jgi:endo-1,4-beta-D-glucanase Y
MAEIIGRKPVALLAIYVFNKARNMNKIIYMLLVVFGLQAQNYPFPQYVNITYSAGVILPNNVTQSAMATKIQTLWSEWKTKYLVTVSYAPQLMYVYYNEDESSYPPNAVAVSEGQGYGMILAAMMAQAGDQTIFDSLFRFCLEFPSSITPSLIGWQQVDEDGTIDYEPNGGDDSATDGDLDVCYALLLADKQWGSNGDINYLAYAQTMMASILSADVNLTTFTTKLGDWVKNSDSKYGKATRPSDFFLNHFKNFATASGDDRWTSVLDKDYAIINTLYNNFSPSTGLLPDFVQFKNNAYVRAIPGFLENKTDGLYYFNACRTPWRIATDYVVTGDTRALDQLTALNSWIRTSAGGLASDINAGFHLDGTFIPATPDCFYEDEWPDCCPDCCSSCCPSWPFPGPQCDDYYDDLAFTTPFAVSAMISSTNQSWLNALWAYTSGYSTNDSNYFGNSIRLLCLLVISGNWWTPDNLPL